MDDFDMIKEFRVYRVHNNYSVVLTKMSIVL